MSKEKKIYILQKRNELGEFPFSATLLIETEDIKT